MAEMVTFETLVEGYLLEIKQTSLEEFKLGTLASLVDKERNGELVSHGELDKNFSLRQSAIPIEERVRAARTAILRCETEAQPRSISYGVDFSRAAARA
jgi:hypothetical protein